MSVLAVALGFLLDLIIGDPRWMYHPVQFIGLMIDFFQKILRKIFPKTKIGERIAGGFLVFFIILISGGTPLCILILGYKISFYLGFALEVIMCYQILATKSLKNESMKVYKKLKEEDIKGARYAVSMIVGRDTENLDSKAVTKATVETIAENTVDGVIAPLFYLALGGPVLGFIYKGINTMDSMVGYKNEKYQYFGTAGARLDDVMNFIPARLGSLFMILSSYLGGEAFSGKNAWYIFKRDRKNHKSPNSAHSEAVMAGALDIQLAGDAVYFGKVVKKTTIGDDNKTIDIDDIKKANNLLYITATLTGVILLSVKFFILFLI